MMRFLSLCLFLCLTLLFACKKDSFITSPDANVQTSTDTLKYDTVFTTVGSVTQSFKIFNNNDQKLRLASIRLAGGNASAYSMNVDGLSTSEARDLVVEANDSLYVFVQVKVDPATGNLPFIIRDSINISYNGSEKWVQLEAWGQNAHFLRDRQITVDETWTNDLPYVIQGFLYIEPGITLNIEKGCRIYVHASAPIIVDGSMKVNGLKDTVDRVYFQGDRRDEPYRNFPAAWPGIYFGPSSVDNVFTYAVLNNAYQAIALEEPATNGSPKIVLNECVINNAFDAGIISAGSSIVAVNCLVSNCGRNVVLGKGGDYHFTHCTLASYANAYVNHKDPVLTVSNAAGGATAMLNAQFRNCIFWGDGGLVENEVVVTKEGSAAFTVNFDHNLWKVQNVPANVTTNQMINNQDPRFDSVNVSRQFYNFRLKDDSPARNSGMATPVAIDLDGNPRPVGRADLGCFEKQ